MNIKRTLAFVIMTVFCCVFTIAKAQSDIVVNNVDASVSGGVMQTQTITIPYNPATGNYEVSTVMHLRAISQAVRDGHMFADTMFTLMNDIAFTSDDNLYNTTASASLVSIPTMIDTSNFLPIGGWLSASQSEGETGYTHSFSGTFDGQNHTVSGLIIKYRQSPMNGVSDNYHVGLFGLVKGTIKNLGVINSEVYGNERVAPLVGRLRDGAMVTNCYTSNCVVNSNGKAGGLVGGCGISTIESSYVVGGTFISNSGSSSKYAEIGGLCGSIKGGKIDNCYVIQTTVAGNAVGMSAAGLVGQANDYGSITNSYVSTKVNSSDGVKVGGIFVADANKTTTVGAYYNSDSIGSVTSGAGGTPLTTTQMLSDAFLDSLGLGFVKDVNNINGGYPITVQQAIATGVNHVKLRVGHFNLVGDFGTTFAALDANSGGNNSGTNYPNDMAAVEYDYATNDWSTSYLRIIDNALQGCSYMVYPFANAQIPAGSTQTSGLVLDNDGKYITLTGALTARATRDVPLQLNNVGTTASGGSATGYWFALSNPFATNLDVRQSSIPSSIQGQTVYIYDAANDTWKTNLGSASIAGVLPCQGFMVAKASAGALNVTLSSATNKMSVSGAKSAISTKAVSDDDAALITFVAKANGSQKTVFARKSSSASNNFDIKDAYVLFSNSRPDFVEPYFLVDDNRILKNEFNSLPYFAPINFHASQLGNVEFSAENIPSGIQVSIIDLQNDNAETILNDGEIFDFVANEGENEGRYKIKFAKSPLSIADVEQVSVNIWNNSRNINVSGENLQSVEVMNALGQAVYNKNINGSEYRFTLSNESGVYLVRVNTKQGSKTVKIVIE